VIVSPHPIIVIDRIMKAAVYSKTKSRKALEIVDADTPIPKESEVLVKVVAASINPLDWRMKSRRPGVDVSGEVVAVGKRVSQFKAGDAVFGAGSGTFAEYACVPEAGLISKPNELTFEQAACIPVAGLTALQGLRDKGRLRRGQKVLVNGASGGIGTFAVQIAKSLGAEVTGVSSTRNVELVRSLGADQAVDYTQEDFTVSGRQYDLVLDNVGNRSLSALRRVMTPRGRCVLAGAPKELWAVILRVFGAFAWSPFLSQKFTFFIAKVKREDLAGICELIKTGKVTTVIDKCYSLSNAAEAIAYVEHGHARAKVVLSIG
jgi:NADPH:quinone reductase-like Zn-dependent oxidoreductase